MISVVACVRVERPNAVYSDSSTFLFWGDYEP